MNNKTLIAVLDDYQRVAFTYADWSNIQHQAQVDVYSDHLFDEADLIERLRPYQAVCIMRERTPLTRQLLAQLPNLKLIVSTGKRNASLDTKACEELGIEVKMTGYHETGAPELTWALLMAITRHIPVESANVRSGGWQTTIGTDLHGKTIGIVGLGRIGARIAGYARAFGMRVIAWSQHLTPEKAQEAGAELVSKEEIFRQSDFVTIHLVLSDRSRKIVGERELALMKSSAYLINTSRGPLIDEPALIDVLQRKGIAGAALDVFDMEPLPADHAFRRFHHVLATPHIGYVTEDTYRIFFRDTVESIGEWLKTGQATGK